MRLFPIVLLGVLVVTVANPRGAIAGPTEATPARGATCDVSRPVAAFIDAWNTGSPERIPVFYDDLDLGLTASDPAGHHVTSAGSDAVDFLAQRPALDDVLSIPDGAIQTVYPWGQESGPWVYVVQQLTRSFGKEPTVPAQLIGKIHCDTAAFGSITIQEPGVPVVAPRVPPPSGSACTNDRVAQPLQTLVTAIADGDSAAIASRLYTATESRDEPDVIRLGEYSFRLPNGDMRQRVDAGSFPTWMTEQFSTDWTLTPMELTWDVAASRGAGDSYQLAEVLFFFLMVDEQTGEAWRGIWKGVTIECSSGTILSLHGGTG